MKTIKTGIITICLISQSYGYIDNDYDGVADNIDICLNTPLYAKVDANGCVKKEKNYGRISIKSGIYSSFNNSSQSSTKVNLFANYYYKNWDISLSTSKYTSKNNDISDIYISGGYMYKKDLSIVKGSIGVKIAPANNNLGTGENDYFASIGYSYFLTDKQDLFAYYSYTISGDSKYIEYENFSSFSIGSGRALTTKFYTSLSYDYSQSNYKGIEDYQALTLFNSYSFSKRYFTTFSYTYALDDLSYKHALSLNFGIRFNLK